MPKESLALKNRPCGMETEFGMMLYGSPASRAGPSFVYHTPDVWDIQDINRIEWDPKARIIGDPDTRGDHQFHKNRNWRNEANFLLKNGARFYLDGGHAEISTPLCANPAELLLWNRACYALVDRLRMRHRELGQRIFTVYRNNVAGGDECSSVFIDVPDERVSFACHENYTTFRHIPLHVLVERLGCGFFPARIPIVGLGKVGADCGAPHVDFQMSQRADFFYRLYGVNTMYHRPIYNTRDVPYANWRMFRRIHVICGDSNMLPFAEYLKIGLTDCALKMIEDGQLGNQLEFFDPVRAIKQISRDSACTGLYDMAHSKRRRSISDILAAYRDLFGDYVAEYHPEDELLCRTIRMFGHVIERLRAGDEESLFGKLDWVTKKLLIQRQLSKRGLSWRSPEAILLDCAYSDNDHNRGMYFRMFPRAEEEFFSQEERQYAEHNPPETRSRWIVEILKRYPDAVIASNYWFTIVARDVMADIGSYIFFQDPRIRFDATLAKRAFEGSFENCIRILFERGVVEVSQNEDYRDMFESINIQGTFYGQHPSPASDAG